MTAMDFGLRCIGKVRKRPSKDYEIARLKELLAVALSPAGKAFAVHFEPKESGFTLTVIDPLGNERDMAGAMALNLAYAVEDLRAKRKERIKHAKR